MQFWHSCRLLCPALMSAGQLGRGSCVGFETNARLFRSCKLSGSDCVPPASAARQAGRIVILGPAENKSRSLMQTSTSAKTRSGRSRLLSRSASTRIVFRPWLSDFLVVEIASGARRGELLALTWLDVAPDYQALTVSKSLEHTKRGLRVKETKARNVRTLGLPSDAIAAWKRIKTSQERARHLYGDAYGTDLDLVFCHPDGSCIRPETVTKAVRRIARRTGITCVNLHTLRLTDRSCSAPACRQPSYRSDWATQISIQRLESTPMPWRVMNRLRLKNGKGHATERELQSH